MSGRSRRHLAIAGISLQQLTWSRVRRSSQGLDKGAFIDGNIRPADSTARWRPVLPSSAHRSPGDPVLDALDRLLRTMTGVGSSVCDVPNGCLLSIAHGA